MATRPTRRFSGNLKHALEGPLKHLIGKRPISDAKATRHMDGRLVPFVLATVVDDRYRPVGGVTIELRDPAGAVLDRTRTSAGGIGVLRFPARKPNPSPARGTPIADGGSVKGTVHVLDADAREPMVRVEISPTKQMFKVPFVLDGPFGDLPVDLPPGDSPLTRLPIDFDEEACDALLGSWQNGALDPNDLTSRPDPLLGSPPADANTLVSKRLPLIHRVNVVRFDEDGDRHLVRLRQEWVLLTYTLGELARVTPLDPGAVVQSASQLVSEISSAAREAVDKARSTLSQSLQDSLSNIGVVNAIVRTVANASVNTSVGGWYAQLPFIVGGGETWTNVDTHLDATVSTRINTSVLVNRAVQQAATLVNEAIAKTHAIVQGTRQAASDIVNNLAPLVSTVTNAFHWRVYEVYAVCNTLEAVHPIIELDLAELLTIADFTAEEVLAFRPFFEPMLLDLTMGAGFDELLTSRGMFTAAVVRVTVDSNLSASTGFGFLMPRVPLEPIVTVSVGGAIGTAVVPAGTSQTATILVNLSTPILPGSTATVTVSVAAPPTPPGLSSTTGTATLQSVEVWIDRPVSGPGVAATAGGTTTFTLPVAVGQLGVPIGASPAAADALVAHVNRNKHYYWGVLVMAAIAVPSLRQDVTALRDAIAANPELAALWRLPLIGMEGTTALLLDTSATSDETGLGDDIGAGTLVQVLAPGAYGEVIKGLLQIPLDALHPLLTGLPYASPFGEFPALPAGSPTTGASGVVGTATTAAGTATGATGGLPTP